MRILRRLDYKEWLAFAIRELRMRRRPYDYLEETLRRLNAQEPNLKTRIDLHDWFTEEAEKPIYPLYCSRFDVWCLQNHGRVPEYGTKLYNMRRKSFDHESRGSFTQ